MPAFTVQQIIDRAAAQAEMSDDYITAAMWLTWFNVEQRALELFCARAGWVQDLASTVDAGVNYEATLTGVPLAVLGAYEVRDGRYRPLRFKNQVDFTKHDGDAITGDAHFYTVVTSPTSDTVTVKFFPQPTSGTYRVLYLSGRAVATALSDSYYWPLGWEERIALGMSMRALTREESDTRPVEKLIGIQEQVIEEWCWSRNLAESPTIRNVDHRERGWTDSMIYGPHESWYWL